MISTGSSNKLFKKYKKELEGGLGGSVVRKLAWGKTSIIYIMRLNGKRTKLYRILPWNCFYVGLKEHRWIADNVFFFTKSVWKGIQTEYYTRHNAVLSICASVLK